MVQVGLSLSNEQGHLSLGLVGNHVAWQINLRGFDEASDLFDSESLKMLKKKIDLNVHPRLGVSPATFGVFFGHISMNNHGDLKFVCFHGIPNLAFLVKYVNQDTPLPDSLKAFMYLLGGYFGTNIYDIKHLVKYSEVPEFVCRYDLDHMVTFYRLGRETGSCQ
ncbi:hypothetical protein DM860_016960 [Cuscuta australis]|uniref:Uncharacterized protein n=1 Tax=Cuscuta australis TaxID=267555 RepID=A0A328E213_9ASTE|nr:hypothetical protein DM860_016960 [Cuscuta australis]